MMHKSHIDITLDTNITDDLRHLLEHTVYGTRDKLQYMHTHPASKLESLNHRKILIIKKRDKVLATAVFVARDDAAHTAFYVRYLSMNPNYKTQGSTNSKKEINSTSILRSNIEQILVSKLVDKSQSVCYSYIEKENTPSHRLAQTFGYEMVRQMQTFVFNRFFPKSDPHVNLIEEKDRPYLLQKLSDTYKDHNFFFPEGVLESGYYVYKKEGKILAGVKITPTTWKIVNIPGFNGFLMLHVFPLLPILNKIFRKENISFGAFEALYYEEGCETELFKLLEGVCAIHHMYMGMMWFDTKSVTAQMLNASNQLGLLNTLNKSGHADVMCKFFNMNESDKNQYRQKPAYISAYDVT